ncbi:uncharacterized protein [Salminus brasiliensis]|uniref:uncharacterized protein n=1 Tax=Salminus brasiliensis TaxID=930266 RepID=UPI003B833127
MDTLILLLLMFYERAASADTPAPAQTLDLSSSQTISVRLNDSITMSCNITGKYEVAWYRLNSRLEELTLLILAEKTRTRKSLPYSYNKDECRLVLTADSEITMARLTVKEVGMDDLGLYFCGTKAEWSQLHFARPIRLQLQGAQDQKSQKEEAENTDGVRMAERALMLIGVGAVALVFLLALIAVGKVIHQRSWCRRRHGSHVNQTRMI